MPPGIIRSLPCAISQPCLSSVARQKISMFGPRNRNMSWPLAFGLDTSKFDEKASTQAPRSTIILVHDAFHTAEYLDELATELRQAGFRVRTPQLPSSSWEYRADSFEADTQTISNAGWTEIEASRNVVIVMHGYGALPASVAANRLNERSLDHPRAGEVTKLVFIAGAIAEENGCCMDMLTPGWFTHEVGSHSWHLELLEHAH